MGSLIAHFAINADDVSATRRFYEQVFGWTFHPWGPPGFYHISDSAARADTAEPPPIGALQQRRELLPGQRTTGFECTVAVPDLAAVTRAVPANGGRLLMERSTIAGVGDLVYVADPSGNVVGAMRYDPTVE